jgi:hypothetical protein
MPTLGKFEKFLDFVDELADRTPILVSETSCIRGNTECTPGQDLNEHREVGREHESFRIGQGEMVTEFSVIISGSRGPDANLARTPLSPKVTRSYSNIYTFNFFLHHRHSIIEPEVVSFGHQVSNHEHNLQTQPSKPTVQDLARTPRERAVKAVLGFFGRMEKWVLGLKKVLGLKNERR